MIIVKAIFDENGTASPESIPDTKFGCLFNGTEFIYFESEVEKADYFKSLDTQNATNN